MTTANGNLQNTICIPNIILNSSLNSTNKFNIAHINGGSAYNKLDEIRNIVSNTPLHALCLGETWFNDSHNDAEINIPGFYTLRCDRDTPDRLRGGGVVLYIRQNFKSRIIYKTSACEIDMLFVEVALHNSKLLICVIYKPPDIYGSKLIEDALGKYLVIYEHILILGDFNINALDRKKSATKSFLSWLQANSLVIVNSEPTHFSDNTSTLIDYIITSDISRISCCNQIDVPGISRHDLIYCSYTIELPVCKDEIVYYRSLRDVDMLHLRKEIYQLNWNLIYNCPSVDEQIFIFNDFVKYLF